MAPSQHPGLTILEAAVLEKMLTDELSLEHGAGFGLFVDDGIATMLEGYTYAGAWRNEENALSFRDEPTRDFARLNQALSE